MGNYFRKYLNNLSNKIKYVSNILCEFLGFVLDCGKTVKTYFLHPPDNIKSYYYQHVFI